MFSLIKSILRRFLQIDRRRAKAFYMGPLEFLLAVHHADCVFTTSFHASAFSLIFNKRLVVRKQPGEGTAHSRFDILDSVVSEEPINHNEGVREFNILIQKTLHP